MKWTFLVRMMWVRYWEWIWCIIVWLFTLLNSLISLLSIIASSIWVCNMIELISLGTLCQITVIGTCKCYPLVVSLNIASILAQSPHQQAFEFSHLPNHHSFQLLNFFCDKFQLICSLLEAVTICWYFDLSSGAFWSVQVELDQISFGQATMN